MALRFNTYHIDSYEERSDGSLRVKAIARHPGVLKYKSDAGDRLELVHPDFNKALDSNGFPYLGQLGGAPVCREHPPLLIRGDSDLEERYQVGEVDPKIRIFQDGKVEVWMDVYDSQTKADVIAGRKRGVSLGYQTNVARQDGVWNGQSYTHVQCEPLRVDHLAIVASPRAPEALITRFDDAGSDGFGVAWSVVNDAEDIDMNFQALLSRLDKGPGCPGPGDCSKSGGKAKYKNSKAGAAKAKAESQALGGLGNIRNTARGAQIQKLKEKLGRKQARDQAIKKRLSDQAFDIRMKQGKYNPEYEMANKKAGDLENSIIQREKVLAGSSAFGKVGSARQQKIEKIKSKARGKQSGDVRKSKQLEKDLFEQRLKGGKHSKGYQNIANEYGSVQNRIHNRSKVLKDSSMENLFEVTYQGQTYHLDAEDLNLLKSAFPDHFDAEDDLEEELDTGLDVTDSEDEEEDSDYEDDTKSDSAEIAAYKARIDALEGKLAIATQLLSRHDEDEDDEEEDEEYMDSAVQEQVQAIFEAYQDAEDYLPLDFKFDGVTSPVDIWKAAVVEFDSSLVDTLDSEEAIAGAYQTLKMFGGRPSPGVSMLKHAVDSANSGRSKGARLVSDAYENAWRSE